MQSIYCIFLFNILILLNYVNGYRDNDLTAEIPAGKKECYYQPIKAGQSLEVEYQVIDGGDLDIDFRVSGPKGNAIITEFRRNDGIQTIDPTEEGDYEICFDNTFSRITKKTVFFELIIDSSDGGDELDDDDGDWKKFVSDEDQFGDQITTLEETMNLIKSNNAKTMQFQALLRAWEARDRNIVERNFTRINFWSAANVVIMLVVFALQVYMVRSMFNDKAKVRT